MTDPAISREELLLILQNYTNSFFKTETGWRVDVNSEPICGPIEHLVRFTGELGSGYYSNAPFHNFNQRSFKFIFGNRSDALRILVRVPEKPRRDYPDFKVFAGEAPKWGTVDHITTETPYNALLKLFRHGELLNMIIDGIRSGETDVAAIMKAYEAITFALDQK